MTMLVCAHYFDIERATRWVRAMDRFIARYGCPFLNAECRANYGRVLFENGDWAAAEAFLAQAILLSKGMIPASHALAAGTLAELRLAQGRIEDAAELLAGLEGRDEPVVAVGMLRLARGEAASAAALLRRRLDEVGTDRLDLAIVVELLGQAEIRLGSGGRAVDRAHRLVALGETHDCHQIIAHGERLLGGGAGRPPIPLQPALISRWRSRRSRGRKSRTEVRRSDSSSRGYFARWIRRPPPPRDVPR